MNRSPNISSNRSPNRIPPDPIDRVPSLGDTLDSIMTSPRGAAQEIKERIHNLEETVEAAIGKKQFGICVELQKEIEDLQLELKSVEEKQETAPEVKSLGTVSEEKHVYLANEEETPILFVSRLPYNFNESDIRELFDPFGTIAEQNIFLSKSEDKGEFLGRCFLIYDEDDVHMDAIETLHEKHKVDGSVIFVQEATFDPWVESKYSNKLNPFCCFLRNFPENKGFDLIGCFEGLGCDVEKYWPRTKQRRSNVIRFKNVKSSVEAIRKLQGRDRADLEGELPGPKLHIDMSYDKYLESYQKYPKECRYFVTSRGCKDGEGCNYIHKGINIQLIRKRVDTLRVQFGEQHISTQMIESLCTGIFQLHEIELTFSTAKLMATFVEIVTSNSRKLSDEQKDVVEKIYLTNREKWDQSKRLTARREAQLEFEGLEGKTMLEEDEQTKGTKDGRNLERIRKQLDTLRYRFEQQISAKTLQLVCADISQLNEFDLTFPTAKLLTQYIYLFTSNSRKLSDEQKEIVWEVYDKEKYNEAKLLIANREEQLKLEKQNALKRRLDEDKKQVVEDHRRKIRELNVEIGSQETKSVRSEYFGIGGFDVDVLKEKNKMLQDALNEFYTAIDGEENIDTVRREIKLLESSLPFYSYRTQTLKVIKDNQVTVLVGETGSGKSTQLAQYMYFANIASDGIIACTQPRAVAAISLQKWVIMGMGVGGHELVGYKVGKGSRTHRNNKIVYLTDARLLYEMADNPILKGYSAILVDEVHERSVDTDVVLGMLKELIPKRPDLKVVIMSATLHEETFQIFFDAPLIKIPGRTFPVKVEYHPSSSSHSNSWNLHACKVAKNIVLDRTKLGDVLVFLTGVREIESCCKELQNMLGKQKFVTILPLHGQLPYEEQQKVFDSTPKGKKKVIFTTNIAETSVTIPGIVYVLDLGLAKEMNYDSTTRMSTLEETTVSKSSAKQRKGRAGRTRPGTCYRLYTEDQFNEMQENPKAEILRTNLAQSVLKMKSLGVKNVLDFQYVDPPDPNDILVAIDELQLLGALDDERELTDIGRRMQRLQLDPRVSKMIFTGIERNVSAQVLIVAAAMSVAGRVFWRGSTEVEKHDAYSHRVLLGHPGGDLITYLQLSLEYFRLTPKKRRKWCKEKFLSFKSMNSIYPTVQQYRNSLKWIDGGEIHFDIQDDKLLSDENVERVRYAICSGFFMNVVVLNGPPEDGYFVPLAQQSAILHPATSYSANGIYPRFCLFLSLVKTSKEFLRDVTEIELPWISQVCPAYDQRIDPSTLLNHTMECITLPKLSNAVMTIFRGKGVLKMIEAKYGAKVSYHHEVGSNDEVWCKPEKVQAVECEIKKTVKSCIEQLERETESVVVSGATRVQLGRGAVIQQILLSDEFLRVGIFNVPPNISWEIKNFQDFIGEEFPLVNVQVTDVQTHDSRGVLTFDKTSTVSNLFNSISHNKIQIENRLCELERRVDYSRHRAEQKEWIHFEYFLGHSKGYGFLTFKDSYDLKGAISGHDCEVSLGYRSITPSKHRPETEAFIGGLARSCSEMDLREAYPKAIRVQIGRQRTDVDQAMKTQQREYCHTLLSTYNVASPSVEIRGHKVIYRALATKKESKKIYNALHGIQSKDGGCIDVRLGSRLRLHELAYKSLKRDIEFMKTSLEKKHKEQELSITAQKLAKRGRNQFWSLSISCKGKGSAVTIQNVRSQFDKLATPMILTCDDLNIPRFRNSRKLCMSIQKKANCFVDFRRNDECFMIYGNQWSKDIARGILSQSLEQQQLSLGSTAVQLRPGAMVLILKEYGTELRTLEDASVTFRPGGKLVVEGSKLQIQNALAKIYSVLKRDEDSQTLDEKENQSGRSETCILCKGTIHIGDSRYELQLCAQQFHEICLKEYIRSEIDHTSKVQISCPDCSKLLAVADIRALLPKRDLERLSKKAYRYHVSQNLDKYSYCPTSGCQQIYYKSETGQFTCNTCENEYCLTCEKNPIPWHTGMDCDAYQSEKTKQQSERDLCSEDLESKREDIDRPPTQEGFFRTPVGRIDPDTLDQITVQLTDLKATDRIHRDIYNRFMDSWTKFEVAAPKRILQIIQIENAYLRERYDKYKAQMYTAIPFATSIIRQGLFHGTKTECEFHLDSGEMKRCERSTCACCDIAKTGFRMSFSKTNTNFARFGDGLYFAPNSSKAHDYTRTNVKYSRRVMFVVNVVVGNPQKVTKTSQNLVLENGYHSVEGVPSAYGDLRYSEFVVYSEAAVLPTHCILYEF